MTNVEWTTARFETFERTGWADRSAAYDAGFGRLTAGAHPDLLDGAHVGPGIRLLEIGCGSGRLSAGALALGADVVATDAVEEMVEVATAVLPGARVLLAALPDLPFEDAEFDAAVGAFVINHVADPPEAIAELARVVRPAGRIALTWWDTAEHNPAQSILLEAAAKAGATAPADLPAGSPFRDHSAPEAFAALLSNAGFQDVGVKALSWIHRIDPDQWWQDILSGTLLMSALIGRQAPETTALIREHYHQIVAAYTNRDGLAELPAGALLATATRRAR